MKIRADLFDIPAIWKADPIKGFDAFVSSPDFLAHSQRKRRTVDDQGNLLKPMPVRASTADVYRDMWSRFVRWAADANLNLYALTPHDIDTFMEQKNADGKRTLEGATIRRQYVTLLERVYGHLGFLPDPASQYLLQLRGNSRKAKGHHAQTNVLTLQEQQRFLDALPNAARDETNPLSGWKVRRDRAMQALILGAGLKVAEAIGAYTDNIGEQQDDGSVPVTVSPSAAGGTVRWHQTILRPFAADTVLAWVDERKKLNIPGRLLFPATRDGGRLDKSTVYRHVKATFAAAGIDVPRRGGRTLRNAFAVRELHDGHTVEEVGEFLGHRKLRAMDRYVDVLGKVQENTARRSASKSTK